MAKKKSIGATRKRTPLPIAKVWLATKRLGIFILAVGLVGAVWTSLTKVTWVPMALRDVSVDSELVYQDGADVKQVMDSYLGQSILMMDVGKIKETVEQLPWIQTASIEKKWPASLVVMVTEHEPVAFWNERLVLNSEGKPLERPQANMTLANLKGPDENAEEVMSHFLQFNQIFQEFGLRVSKVEMQARGSWDVELESGLVVYLGEKNVLKRSRRVVTVLQADDIETENIIYIDARYPNGVAIKFKELETVEVEDDIAA